MYLHHVQTCNCDRELVYADNQNWPFDPLTQPTVATKLLKLFLLRIRVNPILEDVVRWEGSSQHFMIAAAALVVLTIGPLTLPGTWNSKRIT